MTNCKFAPSQSLAVGLSVVVSLCSTVECESQGAELLKLDNGTVQVGIDRNKGGSITWLSAKTYPKNIVNLADAGRLIQQSYYAGKRLDRTADGQHKAWSPWSWNPIQGGGVVSWARAAEFRREDGKLYTETIPKLWDMPNEAARAQMRQWTGFEPDIANTIVVQCEFIAKREANDRWGAGGMSHQEVPACYFTRNFAAVKSYLGDGAWRRETQPPGPPWGHAMPPRKAMACFEANGQGVAVFSPTSTQRWNVGPHAHGRTDDPKAGPCMHVAPISLIKLGPQSTFRYRYWLIIGDEAAIGESLDALWQKYADERAELSDSM